MAFASFDGALFLAFAGKDDDNLNMDVKAFAGPKIQWGPNARDTGQDTDSPPVLLTVFEQHDTLPDGTDHVFSILYVSWRDTDDNDHLARVDVVAQLQQPLQTFPIVNQVLTLNGDQYAARDHDQIRLDIASGKVKITLNGAVMEFALSDISNGIVLNTGGGANTIEILASFPGLPVTINGAGTDHLSSVPPRPRI